MASLDLFSLYATIGIKTDEFEQGIDKAQKKFKSFSDNVSGLSGKIDSVYKGVGDALKPAVDGFKAVEGVGQKAGNAITTGLKGFAAAATAVGGFGTAAVKSGMAFDATMSEVSAISGATGQDFQDLRDKALEMGAKTKFSASEAGEAMTYMGMAGWKTEDMLGGIEGIMNLAAASGEDLASTSDIVTDALTAFGYSAKDAGFLADIMATTATNANTDVGKMGETFKYVAPVAGAMGYTMGETALAIGVMAGSGIKATQAGTSLRSIITRLSTDAGASSKTLGALGVLTEKLGVQFYNTDGSARQLIDVLMDSRDAWKGLSEEQQVTYAKTIAGQEAMSGWLALMNAADADVDKLTDAIVNCNGAAADMASIMEDNLQGDITKLGSAFESLQIAISDSLTPTLREFAQFGQKAMANLLEGFQGGGVSGFMSALSGIVTDGVKMLAEKAPEFASVSLQFVQALADGLLNSGNEILLAGDEIAITLVDGIGAWLSTNSDKLLELGYDLVTNILSAFTDTGYIISENIGKFVPLIADAFAAYHEALFTVGLDILGAIGRGITENKDEIQHWISLAIENMVTSLRENAPSIIEGGIVLLEALAGAIVENLPLIASAGAEIVARLVAGIGTASPAVQAIIATAIIPHILKIIEVVGNIGGAVSSLTGLVSTSINTIIGIGSGLMGGIQALFGLIIANPVVAVITAIIAAIVLLWTKCEWFRDGVISAWNSIKEAWGDVKEFFGGIADSIAETWDNIKSTAIQKWEEIKTSVSEKWEALKTAAVEKFNEIKEEVVKIIGELPGMAFQWGKDLITNFIDGIKSLWTSLKNAVSDVAQVVKDFLGFSEPEKGPLSNFHTYAPDMMKLFAQGITDNAGMLKSAFDKSLDFGSASMDFSTNYAGSGYSVAENAGTALYSGQRADTAAQPIVINLTAQAVLNKQVIGEAAYTYIHNRDRAYGGR